jgi:hypothetical protein
VSSSGETISITSAAVRMSLGRFGVDYVHALPHLGQQLVLVGAASLEQLLKLKRFLIAR